MVDTTSKIYMNTPFRRAVSLYGTENVIVEKTVCDLDRLYRRFERLEFAQNFVEGRIYVSTLGKCRSTEDLARRDDGEGQTEVNSGLVHPALPNYEALMSRFGYDPANHKNMVMWDVLENSRIDNAWVLCLSTDASDFGTGKFGGFIVEISQPRQFFSELSLQMFAMGLADQCLYGPVIYGPRTRIGLAPPLAPDVFIKPPIYAPEKEVRYVWCHQGPIDMQPHEIRFSGVKPYLRLISGS